MVSNNNSIYYSESTHSIANSHLIFYDPINSIIHSLLSLAHYNYFIPSFIMHDITLQYLLSSEVEGCQDGAQLEFNRMQKGAHRESNPGPLEPKSRIIPLDHEPIVDKRNGGAYQHNRIDALHTITNIDIDRLYVMISNRLLDNG